MRIIDLSLGQIIILDVLAWGFFHISISLLTVRLSDEWLTKQKKWFQTKSWEREGDVWQRYFKVKSYKKWIPDGTKIIGKGFSKQSLEKVNATYLNKFIIESVRAELTHWLSVLPSVFFFLWNPVWAGWVMVVYAFVFNIPIILVQRYNRPRFERIIEKYEGT